MPSTDKPGAGVLRWLIAILVLVVLAAGGAWFYLELNLRAGVERAGARVLGVEVSVTAVRPMTDGLGVELRDIRVANPRLFGSRPLLTIERARLVPDPAASARGRLALQRVTLDGVEVHLRMRAGTRINVIEMMDQVDSFRERGLARERERDGGWRLAPRHIRIDNIRMSTNLGPAWGRAGQFTAALPYAVYTIADPARDNLLVSELVAELYIEIASLIDAARDPRMPADVASQLRQMATEQYDKPDRRLTRIQ